MTNLEFFNSRCGPMIYDLLKAVGDIETVEEARQFYFGYIEYLRKSHPNAIARQTARANLAWAIKEIRPTARYAIWNEAVPRDERETRTDSPNGENYKNL